MPLSLVATSAVQATSVERQLDAQFGDGDKVTTFADPEGSFINAARAAVVLADGKPVVAGTVGDTSSHTSDTAIGPISRRLAPCAELP